MQAELVRLLLEYSGGAALAILAVAVTFRYCREPARSPASPEVKAIAFPVAVGLTGQERVEHALYRIDAVARHMEQNAVSDAKRSEFQAEVLQHAVNLLHAKQIVQGQFVGILKRAGISL